MPPDKPPDIVRDDSMGPVLDLYQRIAAREAELRASGASDAAIAATLAAEFPPPPEED